MFLEVIFVSSFTTCFAIFSEFALLLRYKIFGNKIKESALGKHLKNKKLIGSPNFM